MQLKVFLSFQKIDDWKLIEKICNW